MNSKDKIFYTTRLGASSRVASSKKFHQSLAGTLTGYTERNKPIHHITVHFNIKLKVTHYPRAWQLHRINSNTKV